MYHHCDLASEIIATYVRTRTHPVALRTVFRVLARFEETGEVRGTRLVIFKDPAPGCPGPWPLASKLSPSVLISGYFVVELVVGGCLASLRHTHVRVAVSLSCDH